MSPYANIEDVRRRNRRYYAEHRAEVLAKVKKWQVDNPERAEAKRSAHRAANVERYKEYARDWYLRHRQEVIAASAERHRRRMSEEPEVVRAERREIAARRRARIRGAWVEKIEPLVVWERDGHRCGICGLVADGADWHLDHIVPLAKGGEHSYANVQVSHPSCNRHKGAR